MIKRYLPFIRASWEIKTYEIINQPEAEYFCVGERTAKRRNKRDLELSRRL
jgi:hypothetical protein